MKQLIIIIITILSLNTYSQTKEYGLYIPMRTYHYDQTSGITNKFHSTEGGNLGGVFMVRKIKESYWYTEYHLGAIRNSFGRFCIVGNYGIGKRIGKLNLGLAAGIATGYEPLYRPYNDNGNLSDMNDIMPRFFRQNGLAINLVVNVSTSGLIKIGKVKVDPLINISPSFLNSGIVVSF